MCETLQLEVHKHFHDLHRSSFHRLGHDFRGFGTILRDLAVRIWLVLATSEVILLHNCGLLLMICVGVVQIKIRWKASEPRASGECLVDTHTGRFSHGNLTLGIGFGERPRVPRQSSYDFAVESLVVRRGPHRRLKRSVCQQDISKQQRREGTPFFRRKATHLHSSSGGLGTAPPPCCSLFDALYLSSLD